MTATFDRSHPDVAVLVIACLAYDGGIPVRVESAYLPEHLLRRSWVGEFEV
ncbi:Imm49 family immunity protein [Streptomyces sp. NPDC054854]